KRETAVAEATAERKKAMDAHNAVLKEIDDAKTDLVKLCSGGHVERFEFNRKEKKAAKGKAPDAAPGTSASAPFDDEAWRSVRLDSLEPAIKPAKLKVLAEHTPPIETLGQLTDWQASKGDWWRKDIKGLGDGGAEQLIAATDAYWAANPRPAARPQRQGVKDASTSPPRTFAEAAQHGAGRELTTSDVNLAAGDLEALCHAHIRNALQAGTVPELRGVVTVFGLPYVCVLPPAGVGDDRYQLLPLYDAAAAPKDLAPQGSNDITGREATHQGKRYLVGPSVESLLVQDGGAPTPEPGDKEPTPAAAKRRRKAAGGGKAHAKKAKRKGAGR
ncbi:MAG TPA: hypothetical protein VK324_07960, partial [Tepidisphaeraceae bacterium]|nr:hypothetical protein [Tepidisphaeraceae bacterium]